MKIPALGLKIGSVKWLGKAYGLSLVISLAVFGLAVFGTALLNGNETLVSINSFNEAVLETTMIIIGLPLAIIFLGAIIRDLRKEAKA